ncbi:hypothetical protein F5Y04DRAFT_266825 [Hypomontagnella monticulosa]|nr:hypothetical protein F5Y04DRAFT_266825 [Hypomontagnella monticulosa]
MASTPPEILPAEVSNGDTAAPAPQIPDDRGRAEQSAITPSSDPPPNTHRCFVCLCDEPEESLPADWSTPCICALEGHHECLMAWVTDLEAQDKEIKCPLCKSPITIMERWDPIIRLGNYLNITFSRWSPRILFGFVASGAWVSSAIYGAKAIEWFAGPEAAMDFLVDSKGVTFYGFMLQRDYGRFRNQGPAINVLHFAILPLIAPGLVLNRLRLGEVVLIPASLLYAMVIDQTNDLLTWPPSPQRALALYPAIRATYFHLYSKLSKHLEKRWEAKARKLAPPGAPDQPPPTEDHPEPAVEAGNLLDFEIDIQIGVEEDENRGNNRRNREDGRSPVNLLAGALLWPEICYGMGELLRLALPARFVTRPRFGANTGILQERWGRSLVGGCLFVVLKDAFFLWVKYRRTMNRSSRRIKNAENRTIRR